MTQSYRQQKVNYRQNAYQNYGYTQAPIKKPAQTPILPAKRKKIRKKNSFKLFLSKILLLALLIPLGIYILPTGFHRITKPLIFGHNYKNITFDSKQMLFPTLGYLSNDWFMGNRLLAGANLENPEMTTFFTSKRLTSLENKLIKLMESYPSIKPAIYVWDYNTGNYADINGSKVYSAASIIKIPVLIQMFKLIEAGEFNLYDEMKLTNYYKASGSGSLQYYKNGTNYTLNKLAKVMIQDSDNTATNMLIAKTGSMTAINQSLRKWGLKDTYIQTWLPDLTGTNYTTAKDLTTMLYNLDNPSFLNISSREYIIDYMSKVKNNRLIQAGLGKDALFIHKTGDIGTMLGDAGIVYLPDNKKYAVVILANRPYNSPQGVNFIKNASAIIYDYMKNSK